jgi:thiamine-phosphate pyrophosphorylase
LWLPRLWLLTDERRLADPVAAAAALASGAGVILRHYGDPNRAALADRLARLCRARRIVLLIASDAALAAAVHADGVHLPEHQIARATGIRRQRKHWLITAAAHSWPALHRAARAGCDAALLSPVFATASLPSPKRSSGFAQAGHPDRQPLGVLRFAALARRAGLPAIALGGVTPATIRRLKGSRHAGIAGIGMFKR